MAGVVLKRSGSCLADRQRIGRGVLADPGGQGPAMHRHAPHAMRKPHPLNPCPRAPLSTYHCRGVIMHVQDVLHCPPSPSPVSPVALAVALALRHGDENRPANPFSLSVPRPILPVVIVMLDLGQVRSAAVLGRPWSVRVSKCSAPMAGGQPLEGRLCIWPARLLLSWPATIHHIAGTLSLTVDTALALTARHLHLHTRPPRNYLATVSTHTTHSLPACKPASHRIGRRTPQQQEAEETSISSAPGPARPATSDQQPSASDQAVQRQQTDLRSGSLGESLLSLHGLAALGEF
jgi:hypothetical protein